MQHPASHVLIETTPRSPQRLALNAIAVGGLYIALIYALLTALNIKIMPLPQHPVIARVLPTPEAPPTPPRPPEIPMAQPMLEQVPMPVVKIETPSKDPITVDQTEHPTHAIPQPLAPIAPTPAVSLAGTHSTPPYPPLSRRLGEEGEVGLHILIAADGRISNVDVTRSSGVERLDDAAKQWVLANWRYRAATKDGHTVASETQAVVVFNLKTARR